MSKEDSKIPLSTSSVPVNKTVNNLFPFEYLKQSLDVGTVQEEVVQAIGFVGVGKLLGTYKGALFQSMLSSFCEKRVYQISWSFDNDFESNSGEAISFIPPRLVVRIVAELAIGLLVPSTPLPPDTILNHAVFYWLMNDFLFADNLEAEIESEHMDGDGEDESMMSMTSQFDMDAVRAEVNKTLAVGAVGTEEDRLNRKADRKNIKEILKKEGLKKDADDDALMSSIKAAEENDTESSEAEHVQHVDQFMKQVEANKRDLQKFKKPVDLSKEYWYSTRSALRNCLAESHVGKTVPQIIPQVRDTDIKKWRHVLSWLFSGPTPFIALPEKSLICILQREHSTSAQLLRKRMIQKHVDAAYEQFEKIWTPGNAVFTLRILQTLSGFGMPDYQKIPILTTSTTNMYTNAIQILDGDENHPAYEQMRDALISKISNLDVTTDTAEAREEVQRRFLIKKEGIRHVLWIEAVWRYSRENPRGSNLSIENDIEFLYEAIRYATTEDETTFSNDQFCDAYELLKHPTEIREKREKEKNEGRCHKCNKTAPRKEFQRCSRCQLVMYCDTTCQRGDWKDHKKMCNLMSMGREEMMEKREKKEKKKEKKKKKRKR